MASIHPIYWKRTWPISRSAFLSISGVDGLPSRYAWRGAAMQLRPNRTSDRTLVNHMETGEKANP